MKGPLGDVGGAGVQELMLLELVHHPRPQKLHQPHGLGSHHPGTRESVTPKVGGGGKAQPSHPGLVPLATSFIPKLSRGPGPLIRITSGVARRGSSHPITWELQGSGSSVPRTRTKTKYIFLTSQYHVLQSPNHHLQAPDPRPLPRQTHPASGARSDLFGFPRLARQGPRGTTSRVPSPVPPSGGPARGAPSWAPQHPTLLGAGPCFLQAC